MNGGKFALTIACLLLITAPAHAYIGPGGGLSALGALLALFAALVVAFVGFVWYPIRRMRRNRRERAASDAASNTPAPTPDPVAKTRQ